MSDTQNNVDASDNLIENDDLLSILSQESSSELERAMTTEDDKDSSDADDKMKELRELATQMETSSKVNNPGSGDIDTDLSNWFNGTDKLPSDNLTSYMGNATIKMDYGLTRQTLTNFDMMGSLHKFLDSSFELLFDDMATMGLTPDELEDRVKLAFTMYKELASINQRTVMSIKDFKLKTGSEGGEINKISLLLSSIPSDKLKALLTELSSK